MKQKVIGRFLLMFMLISVLALARSKVFSTLHFSSQAKLCVFNARNVPLDIFHPTNKPDNTIPSSDSNDGPVDSDSINDWFLHPEYEVINLD